MTGCYQTVRSSLSASKRFWCAEASDVYIRKNLCVNAALSSGKLARLSLGSRNFNVCGYGHLYAQLVLDMTGLDLLELALLIFVFAMKKTRVDRRSTQVFRDLQQSSSL